MYFTITRCYYNSSAIMFIEDLSLNTVETAKKYTNEVLDTSERYLGKIIDSH